MSRWRIVVVGVLILIPFAALAILGSIWLWREGLVLVVWWPLLACMILGYVLAWRWQRSQQLLRPVDSTPAVHWTERDNEAWKLVDARARRAAELDPHRLVEFQFYVDQALEIALELARFYNPRAADPVSALTIPEILAVTELASQDLADLVDQYLPAGHLLTVSDWRRAKQVSNWYQTASNVYWAASALFSPVNTSVRYLASKAGMARPWQLLQENLLAWFYTAFVYRVGTYLIEVYSGRLRVGARRYRELRHVWRPGASFPGNAATADPVVPGSAEPAAQITLTVVGQVKAGKSSFINALLGEQKAVVDMLPATSEITGYRLQPADISSRLMIYDTVGYGHTGPREDQLRATEEAARNSDLIILVLHARNPARRADAEMLGRLRGWFATQPDLKLPPILAVMTHIDLLMPAMEWQPPYDWSDPVRLKEQQVNEACQVVRDQLGDYLVGVVPLCTAPGKVYGIDEWFLPAVAELLDGAHAVALLRCLKAEANTGKVQKVLRQLLQAGAQVARILWAPTAPPEA
jgi:predicted GTPase